MKLGILANAGSGKDTMADYLVEKHGFVKISFADPFKRFAEAIFGFSHGQLWGPSEERNAVDSRLSYPEAVNEVRYRFGKYAPPFFASVLPDYVRRSDDKAFVAYQWLNQWLSGLFLEGDISPRKALQTIGTEWGRAVAENIWVEHAIKTADLLLDPATKFTQYTPSQGLIAASFYVKPKGVVFSDCRFKNEIALVKDAGGAVVRLKRAGKDGTIVGGVAGHLSEEEQKSIPDSDLDAVLDVPEGFDNYYRAIDGLMESLWSAARK